MAQLGKEAMNENFLISFIKFEIKSKHLDRAQILFKYAMKNLPELQ